MLVFSKFHLSAKKFLAVCDPRSWQVVKNDGMLNEQAQ